MNNKQFLGEVESLAAIQYGVSLALLYRLVLRSARIVCWEVIFVDRTRMGPNRDEYDRIEGFLWRMGGEWSQPNRPDKFGICKV